MTLGQLLADAAIETAEADAASGVDGAVMWSRRGRSFASLSGDGATASFGLDPAVAAAAVRTPDVGPSSVGAGWVAFSPADLDARAADRARAWFLSAYRRLDEPRR